MAPDRSSGVIDARQPVLLGHIADAHGIRGEVLIKTLTAASEAIAAYGPLTDASGTRSFEITNARVGSKGVIARIKGVADRNAAEALKGTGLYVARARLPPAREGEFYHADLIGSVACDVAGGLIGSIVAVQNFGAGDILEIEITGTGKTEMIPFTRAFVPEVDLRSRRVVVVLPDQTDAAAPCD